MCGSEPVMGALENSTSNNHCSVGSSSDKCAFSNSRNSAKNVTKKNVEEFSRVLCNPCEPVISSDLKMFRDGPLENLWGGGRSTKKIFAQGKIK